MTAAIRERDRIILERGRSGDTFHDIGVVLNCHSDTVRKLWHELADDDAKRKRKEWQGRRATIRYYSKPMPGPDPFEKLGKRAFKDDPRASKSERQFIAPRPETHVRSITPLGGLVRDGA